jgi:hypothetical protein
MQEQHRHATGAHRRRRHEPPPRELLFELVVRNAMVIPDRIPEANSAEPHDDHWDSDRTDVLGTLDELGETRRRDARARPLYTDIPRFNEDRLDDLGS